MTDFFSILQALISSHFYNNQLSQQSQTIHGPNPFTSRMKQKHSKSMTTLITSIFLGAVNFPFGNGSMYLWLKHLTRFFFAFHFE